MSQGHCIHIPKDGSSIPFACCCFSTELRKYEVLNVKGEKMPAKNKSENYQRGGL